MITAIVGIVLGILYLWILLKVGIVLTDWPESHKVRDLLKDVFEPYVGPSFSSSNPQLEDVSGFDGPGLLVTKGVPTLDEAQ